MENKYKVIAQLKQYKTRTISANNESLDALISEVKGFIYDTELEQEYNQRIQLFKTLQKTKKFKDKTTELYSYFDDGTDYFDVLESKPENLLFDNIDCFYDSVEGLGRNYEYYLMHEYDLFRFVEDVLDRYIGKKAVYSLSTRTKILNIFLDLQNMIEGIYSFYILSKEDNIINLYKGKKIYVFQYKLALLNVLNELLIFLKKTSKQQITDLNTMPHFNLTSKETLIFNAITEDSLLKSIGEEMKDKSKDYGTTYKHFKNIALKLNGTEKDPLKSIKKYKRKYKLY